MNHNLEYLKSLRFIYGLVITISTAISVFVLTPDESARYKGALTELATLRALRTDRYFCFAYRRLGNTADQQRVFIASAAQKAGLSIPRPPMYRPPAIVDFPPDTSDIFGFAEFFRNNQRLAAITISSGEDELVNRIRREAAKQRIHSRLVEIRSANFPNGSVEACGATIVRRNDDSERPTSGQIQLVFENSSPGQSPPTVVIAAEFQREPIPVEKLGLQWLQQDVTGRDLIDSKTGIILPHLREFWNQIGNPMDIGSTTIFLQQQLQALKGGTVSFFGISVNSSLLIAVGPIICLAVLLFFQVMFSSFVGRTNLVDRSLRDFPFILLVPGKCAGLIGFSSLVYPVIVNTCLLWKYGEWTGSQSWIGLTATLILAYLVVVVCRDLYQLRKRLRILGG